MSGSQMKTHSDQRTIFNVKLYKAYSIDRDIELDLRNLPSEPTKKHRLWNRSSSVNIMVELGSRGLHANSPVWWEHCGSADTLLLYDDIREAYAFKGRSIKWFLDIMSKELKQRRLLFFKSPNEDERLEMMESIRRQLSKKRTDFNLYGSTSERGYMFTGDHNYHHIRNMYMGYSATTTITSDTSDNVPTPFSDYMDGMKSQNTSSRRVSQSSFRESIHCHQSLDGRRSRKQADLDRNRNIVPSDGGRKQVLHEQISESQPNLSEIDENTESAYTSPTRSEPLLNSLVLPRSPMEISANRQCFARMESNHASSQANSKRQGMMNEKLDCSFAEYRTNNEGLVASSGKLNNSSGIDKTIQTPREPMNKSIDQSDQDSYSCKNSLSKRSNRPGVPRLTTTLTLFPVKSNRTSPRLVIESVPKEQKYE